MTSSDTTLLPPSAGDKTITIYQILILLVLTGVACHMTYILRYSTSSAIASNSQWTHTTMFLIYRLFTSQSHNESDQYCAINDTQPSSLGEIKYSFEIPVVRCFVPRHICQGQHFHVEKDSGGPPLLNPVGCAWT